MEKSKKTSSDFPHAQKHIDHAKTLIQRGAWFAQVRV